MKLVRKVDVKVDEVIELIKELDLKSANRLAKEVLKLDYEDFSLVLIVENNEIKEKPIIKKWMKYPSTRIEFNKWQQKKIDSWNANDFLGFYLNIYCNNLLHEDVQFVINSSAEDKAFVKEKTIIKRVLQKKFTNDKKEMRLYIKWIIPWFVSEESWVDGVVKFNSIFSQRTSTFYNEFRKASNSKAKRDKIKFSRRTSDSLYADKSKWDGVEE